MICDDVRLRMKQLIPPSSGSVAGTTYSRNRFGQYIRKRATPTNPATAKQVARRAIVTAASAAWKGLTQLSRDSWKSWAENHPKLDSLGQQIWLTGFQWFVSTYSNAETAGQALPADAPAEPVFDPGVITSLTLLDGDIEFALAPSPTTQVIVVRASFPRSAGVSFEKDFRLVKVLPVGTATGADVGPEYQAIFGVPLTGQKLFFRCNQIIDGIMGPDMNFDGIMQETP